jgi:hypothetical protein
MQDNVLPLELSQIRPGLPSNGGTHLIAADGLTFIETVTRDFR